MAPNPGHFPTDHHRIQTGMSQPAGETPQVIRIGLEIAGCERMPERMRVDRFNPRLESVLPQHPCLMFPRFREDEGKSQSTARLKVIDVILSP